MVPMLELKKLEKQMISNEENDEHLTMKLQ